MLIRSSIKRRSLITGATASAAYTALRPDRVMAQSPFGTFHPTVPAPAKAAGFTNLVFSDDFDIPGTIAPSANSPSGYNWYWAYNVTSNMWNLYTTATAASISNGNTGGGSNASPNGGIVEMVEPVLSPNTYAVLVTIPANNLNYSGAQLPALGDGHWRHFYAEAYLQSNINGNTISGSPGWPAFWAWAAQGLQGYGDGSSSIAESHWTELDIMEMYGTLFNVTAGYWTGTVHQWPEKSSSQVSGFTDNNWHIFGCLWKSTGPNTGTITFYFDNFQVGNPIAVGAGYAQSQIETGRESLFLILSSGWPLYVDWVRVWQA